MNVWWWTAIAATFAILWKGTAPKAAAPAPARRTPLPSVFDQQEEMKGEELPDVSGHVETLKEEAAPEAQRPNPFRGNGHPTSGNGTLSETEQEVGDEREFNLEDDAEGDGYAP